MSLLHDLIGWIVATIGHLGYPGVVFLMFLESSFFPFPSEVVVPPAGYLASTGEMNLLAVIASGILGSLLGALFNYWIAVHWGRPFFERFGKYFLVTPSALDKADRFFARHGHISTFTGRLLPVIRQYVSLPAGIARMPLGSFCFFTSLGSGLWVVVLALVGYWIGNNQDLVHLALQRISFVLVGGCVLLVGAYVWRLRRRTRGADSSGA